MRAGDLIAERFEVGQLAGSGGVGQVFRARDRREGGHVALKVLRPPSAGDTCRFAREVRVLARLRHPAIVRYVAHGQTPEGEPYLAMEWLEGEDLAMRLSRGPLRPAESVELVRRAADALAVAHAHGIVHRDIKPSNLFLRNGRIEELTVLDFGLAWLVDASRELTRTGLVVGTLGFMAPEQAVGDRSIDARADVFSLGCVLYRCLTGRPAFDSERIGAVLMKILHEDPPRVSELAPGIPPELDAFVARMLAKDPAARPSDGADVAGMLAALQMSVPVSSDAISTFPPMAITRTERRFLCFVAVGTRGNWLSPAGSGILVLFEASASQIDQVRAIADGHGGHLEALADGSLLVTLGGGASATDLASNGARCALAVRALLPRTPVAVAMGRGDHTSGRLVGTAIDIAAELLGSAAPAAAPEHGPLPIRIDATSAGLLHPTFEVGGDNHGLLLLGERLATERPRLLLGKPTPFVGRERELSALRGLFDECANEGVARMMLVTGPPGCGKSRVRRELLRGLRERGEATEIWTAAGQPMTTGSPFALVGGLVRAAARLTPEDAPAVRRQKLSARVQRHMEGAAAERVATFLGEIATAPFPEDEGELGVTLRAARAEPALMAEQVRRAWHELLAAECTVQPVVLVLEDLQWGDAPSLGLVTSAVRRMHNLPLVALGFGRTEVYDVFPRLSRDAAVQEMRLGELTARASERLLRAVVGDRMSPADLASLVERAGGNPFYLEELLRAEVDGRGEGLPETVLAMVQARLEGFDPEARRVLRAASIFGPNFHLAGVRALLGLTVLSEDLRHWIEALIEAEMIEAPSGTWEDSGELAFRHATVCQAVYATLADADRRLGHKLAAAWLEDGAKGDAATMARHFTLGGEPQRAAAWHLVAAEAALAGSDLPTALADAEQGIAQGATGELLGALRGVQMRACAFAGQPAEAERHAAETLQLLPVGGARWCSASAAAGLLAALLDKRERLAEIGEALLAVTPEDDALGAYVGATSACAVILHRLGHHDRAERLQRRTEELLPAVPPDDAFARGWVELTRAYHAGIVAADPWRQREYATAAAACFERVGDRVNAGHAGLQVGAATIAMGAYAEATAPLRKMIAGMERSGIKTVAALARSQLGVALSLQSELDEARTQATEAVRIAAVMHNPHIERLVRRILMQVLLACGDGVAAEAEARRLVPEAWAATRGENDSAADPANGGAEAAGGAAGKAWPKPEITSLPEAELQVTLAQLFLLRGRTQDALHAADAAMTWLNGHGGIGHLEATLRLVHADALEATGQHEAADAARRRARERLNGRAAKIPDATMRASFLSRVQENVRTLAASWPADCELAG